MKEEKEVRKEEDIEKMSKEELDKISGGTENEKGFLSGIAKNNGGKTGEIRTAAIFGEPWNN